MSDILRRIFGGNDLSLSSAMPITPSARRPHEFYADYLVDHLIRGGQVSNVYGYDAVSGQVFCFVQNGEVISPKHGASSRNYVVKPGYAVTIEPGHSHDNFYFMDYRDSAQIASFIPLYTDVFALLMSAPRFQRLTEANVNLIPLFMQALQENIHDRLHAESGMPNYQGPDPWRTNMQEVFGCYKTSDLQTHGGYDLRSLHQYLMRQAANVTSQPDSALLSRDGAPEMRLPV